ncbi:MAG: HIT family protein [Patescibacteria group bacterium]
MEDCPLCFFSRQDMALSNTHCLFMPNREQDVLIGSGIILPRKHRETVFDLTPEEWAGTYDLLLRVKRHLERLFHPQGFNIGWNVGQTAGQEIFHAHLHVIPRYSDEPLAGKGIRYWLKQEENRRSFAARQ